MSYKSVLFLVILTYKFWQKKLQKDCIFQKHNINFINSYIKKLNHQSINYSSIQKNFEKNKYQDLNKYALDIRAFKNIF